jgi:hypothetical protein
MPGTTGSGRAGGPSTDGDGESTVGTGVRVGRRSAGGIDRRGETRLYIRIVNRFIEMWDGASEGVGRRGEQFVAVTVAVLVVLGTAGTVAAGGPTAVAATGTASGGSHATGGLGTPDATGAPGTTDVAAAVGPVTDCRVFGSPGVYEIASFTNDSAPVCFEVDASNVTLVGTGDRSTVTGNHTGMAVRVYPTYANVTVRNLAFENWGDGPLVESDGTTLENVAVRNTTRAGIVIRQSSATVRNVTVRNATETGVGVAAGEISGDGLVVEDVRNGPGPGPGTGVSVQAGIQSAGLSLANVTVGNTTRGVEFGPTTGAVHGDVNRTTIRGADEAINDTTQFGVVTFRDADLGTATGTFSTFGVAVSATDDATTDDGVRDLTAVTGPFEVEDANGGGPSGLRVVFDGIAPEVFENSVEALRYDTGLDRWDANVTEGRNLTRDQVTVGPQGDSPVGVFYERSTVTGCGVFDAPGRYEVGDVSADLGRFDTCLEIDHGDVHLAGTGGSTIEGTGDGTAVGVGTGATGATNLSVADLAVDGFDTGVDVRTATATVDGVRVANASEGIAAPNGRPTVRNVVVADAAREGVRLAGAATATLRNVTVDGAGTAGVDATGAGTVDVDGLVVRSSPTAIDAGGAGSATLRNVTATGAVGGPAAIRADGAGTAIVENATVANATGLAVNVSGGGDATVSALRASNVSTATDGTPGTALVVGTDGPLDARPDLDAQPVDAASLSVVDADRGLWVRAPTEGTVAGLTAPGVPEAINATALAAGLTVADVDVGRTTATVRVTEATVGPPTVTTPATPGDRENATGHLRFAATGPDAAVAVNYSGQVPGVYANSTYAARYDPNNGSWGPAGTFGPSSSGSGTAPIPLSEGEVAFEPGAAGAVHGVFYAPTPLDDCVTVDAPGVYEVDSFTTAVEPNTPCIGIASENVTLTGTGGSSTVTGNGSGFAVDPVAPGLSNVTVRDLTVADWESGVLLKRVENATVRDVRIADVDFGVTVGNANGSTVENVTVVRAAERGVGVNGGGTATLRNVTLQESEQLPVVLDGGRTTVRGLAVDGVADGSVLGSAFALAGGVDVDARDVSATNASTGVLVVGTATGTLEGVHLDGTPVVVNASGDATGLAVRTVTTAGDGWTDDWGRGFFDGTDRSDDETGVGTASGDGAGLAASGATTATVSLNESVRGSASVIDPANVIVSTATLPTNETPPNRSLRVGAANVTGLAGASDVTLAFRADDRRVNASTLGVYASDPASGWTDETATLDAGAATATATASLSPTTGVTTTHAAFAADPFSCPVVDGIRTTDPDRDGICEDVDGDGDVDFLDVVTLLFLVGDDQVEGNAEVEAAFDVDGSGSFDFLDVVALLFEI